MKKPEGLISKLFDGKTVEQIMVEQAAKHFQRSWSNQPTHVRKVRMDYVVKMSVEYSEILKTEIFSTAFCKMAVEAVVTGDLDSLRMLTESFSFESEGPDYVLRYGPVFAKFREICQEAIVSLEACDGNPDNILS